MRLKEVKELIEKEGLSAFLFSSGANVQYLTGFRSTHAYALVSTGENYLLTDGRYFERAKRIPRWHAVLIEGHALRFIKRFLKERGLRLVGYEKDRITCSMARQLRSKGIRWKGYEGFLNAIRSAKTPEELRIMEEGVRKSDEVYMRLLEFVRPGMRELEVRAFLIGEFLRLGAYGESFPAIVASGEASAVPHWETSERTVEHGRPLLIDMGMVWKGYCTDFTRTIHMGRATEEFKKVYGVVRDAHLYALEAVREGRTVGEVDARAREHLERKGLGKYFTHSTGHGVGVEIHEHPRVYHKGPGAKEIIKEGMVFTVEPGVYIPGEFGVRLENMVAVRGGVGEPLSQISLDLVEL